MSQQTEQVKVKSQEKKSKGEKGKKEKEDNENPWAFCDSLPTLMEGDKLDKASIAKLCCVNNFGV